MLRLQGAELIEVPAVPYSNPNNYVKVSGRIAEKLAKEHPHGAIWANQFDNVANRQGHIDTTGPEIYAQTDGKVDGFTCAVGTGGSLAGVGMALKARNKDIKIAITDPMGAALYSYYTTGTLKSEGSSITEGIGQGRITANLVDAPIDMAFQVPDEEALPIVFELAEHEGLLLAGCSPIPACAMHRSCSTRLSCARRNCRCPIGWNAPAPSTSAWCKPSASIVFIADSFEPACGFSIQCFLNGDMRHGCGR